jgi:hypothetical protein
MRAKCPCEELARIIASNAPIGMRGIKYAQWDREIARNKLDKAAADGNWNSVGHGTPYGVTYTHFAIVSRGAATNWQQLNYWVCK